MTRREFSKETKRQALKRAGDICEARGEWYGLPPGQRCGNRLNQGVEFDHVDLDANSKDASLENCAAVCPACHKWKTRHHDIPLAAKTLRQQDKHRGIRAPHRWGKRKLPTSRDRLRLLAKMAAREEARR